MPKRRACKGCGSTSRKLPYPGPRCYTCNKARKAQTRDQGHARRIWANYRLSAEDYEAILALQGGACAMCQRAKGKRKKLAVDHDHACCPETPTCGKCTRGLLCATCNKLLGHMRDSTEFAERVIAYLQSPPAKNVG